jgi:hypothetical protein
VKKRRDYNEVIAKSMGKRSHPLNGRYGRGSLP